MQERQLPLHGAPHGKDQANSGHKLKEWFHLLAPIKQRSREKQSSFTFDLTARMILGRATIRHFNAMVKYFSTKSVIPTIHIRSKKSSLSRLGFKKIRLKSITKSTRQWMAYHLHFNKTSLAPVWGEGLGLHQTWTQVIKENKVMKDTFVLLPLCVSYPHLFLSSPKKVIRFRLAYFHWGNLSSTNLL